MTTTFVASSDQLRAIGQFLDALNTATSETSVTIADTFVVEINNESTIRASWHSDIDEYVIDDMVGAE